MSTHTVHRLPSTFLREPTARDDTDSPFVRALSAWDAYLVRHGDPTTTTDEPTRRPSTGDSNVTRLARTPTPPPAAAADPGSDDLKAS